MTSLLPFWSETKLSRLFNRFILHAIMRCSELCGILSSTNQSINQSIIFFIIFCFVVKFSLLCFHICDTSVVVWYSLILLHSSFTPRERLCLYPRLINGFIQWWRVIGCENLHPRAKSSLLTIQRYIVSCMLTL